MPLDGDRLHIADDCSLAFHKHCCMHSPLALQKHPTEVGVSSFRRPGSSAEQHVLSAYEEAGPRAPCRSHHM